MRSLTGFIPARGGSKGVIRKNLRLVDGKPLVQHAIELARSACDSVIVSTDDADIAAVARLCGAGVVKRPDWLAGDTATVDEVVDEYRESHDGPLLVIQPTVVGVDYMELQQFVGAWGSDPLQSVWVMAVADRHILWDELDLTTERLNRQDMTGMFREVGIRLYPAGEENGWYPWVAKGPVVDIDTPEDLLAARHMMEKKRILFRVLANKQVGHGHLRRVLALAEELQHHHIGITLDARSDADVISLIPPQWLATEFVYPDVVVNDTLDTDLATDFNLRFLNNAPRVHFEDKGPGTRGAAAVVNALYPGPDEYGGPDWAIIRPEFHAVPKVAGEGVLISFGGTDPAGLTETMANKLSLLRPRVIKPPGRTLNDVDENAIVVEEASVAEEMARSKVVVTGGGRTVYEALFCHRPVVAVCQNPREQTHSHLAPGFGVFAAGLAGFGGETAGALGAINLMSDERMWGEFHQRTVGVVDGLGVRRCGTLIEQIAAGLRR